MSNLNNKILHVIRILVFGDLQLCFAQTAFFYKQLFQQKIRAQKPEKTFDQPQSILYFGSPISSSVPKNSFTFVFRRSLFFKIFLHQSSFKKNIFQINGEVINITSLQFITRPPLARFLILQIQCGTC